MQAREMLTATHKLEESGMTQPQAEAIASTIVDAIEPLATKMELRFEGFNCRIWGHAPQGVTLMAENREPSRKTARIETRMPTQGREGALRDLLRDHPQTKTIRRAYRQESKHIPTRVRAGCAS